MTRKLKYNFLTLPSLAGHDDYQSTPGTPDLSIARTTKATDTDADGWIREYQAGEARFIGATFAHNLVPNSVSGSFNSNTTQGSAIANPLDGTVDANRITENDTAAGSSHYVSEENTIATKVGHDYLFSVYLKADDRTAAGLYMTGGNDGKYFNLSTGAVGDDFVGAPVSSGITDVGGGWYRCWVVVTATTTSGDFRIYLSTGTTGNDYLYDGDGTSGLYHYGLMVEDVSGKVSPTPSTYIPTTGAAKSSLTGTSTLGLMVEEARTNICLQSEDFSTTWIPSNAQSLVNTNQAVSPDGSTTADRIIDDGSTGPGIIGVAQVLTVTAVAHTFSAFIKADGDSWAYLQTISFDAAANGSTWFNLSTGAVGTQDANHSNAGVEDYGNGWYRCWIVFTSTTDLAGQVRINVAEADNTTTVTRDGTSSIFVWGAQVEAGALPTSYIATTTVSVTRNADDVSATDVSWFNQTTEDGTWYVSAGMYEPFNAGGTPDIAPVNVIQNAGNNISPIVWGNRGTAARAWTSGGAATAFALVGTGTEDTDYKAAVGFALNDVQGYFDGVAGTPDTSYDRTGAAALDTFRIGIDPFAGNYYNGHIAEIVYWDERFANPILAEISTGNFSNTEDQVFIRKKARDRFRRRYRRT